MTAEIIKTVGQERVQDVPGDLVVSIHKVLSLVATKHLKEAFDLVPQEIYQLLDRNSYSTAHEQEANFATILDVFKVFYCATNKIIDSTYETLSKAPNQKLDVCAVMSATQYEVSGECPG
jgi:hypothetical protein